MSYTPTIGLEVHAELKTKAKMFCGCQNAPHDEAVNAHTCPVCLAHPGTLPVPNEKAIEMVLLFGAAVGANVANYTEFDRKHYFYPDIPKAYQISQYAFPFLTGGSLSGVTLTRVHLEEDTARSQHDKGAYSLVNFNRAGVPLMELVTEPTIHSAEQAATFAKELQLLLRTLNISDANMELGEMRVEANVSVSADASVLGTKVEVKNLNSFRSVEGAIRYEIERQVQVLHAGESIEQETRGWDEVKLRTFTQRSKETAKDYRYFPDPDIPKIMVAEHVTFSPSLLAKKMPELPNKTRSDLSQLGLASKLIEIVLADQTLLKLVKEVQGATSNPELLSTAVNYLVSDVPPLLKTRDSYDSVAREPFITLMDMLVRNEIGSRVAKDLLPDVIAGSLEPRSYAEAHGLLRVSDSSALSQLAQQIVNEHPTVVAEYRQGKEKALKFLVGTGMKITKGSADPIALEAELLKVLQA